MGHGQIIGGEPRSDRKSECHGEWAGGRIGGVLS